MGCTIYKCGYISAVSRRHVEVDLIRYDSPIILAIVLLAYLGWIAFCAVTLSPPDTKPAEVNSTRTWHPYVVAMAILAVVFAYFATQSSPPEYYVYAVFPGFFWAEVFRLVNISLSNIRHFWGPPFWSSSLEVLLAIAAVQTMVVRPTFVQAPSALTNGHGVVRIYAPICLERVVGYDRRRMASHFVGEGGPVSTLAFAARLDNLLPRVVGVSSPEYRTRGRPLQDVSIAPFTADVVRLTMCCSTCGALAMCPTGWVGARNLKPSNARGSWWFKAMVSVLVRHTAARPSRVLISRLRSQGWR